jgi:hypothetical protein
MQPSAAFTPAELQAQAQVILPADLSNSTQNVSVDVIAPPTIQRAAAGSGMLASLNYQDNAGTWQGNSINVQVPGASGVNQIYLDDTLLPSSQTAALPIASYSVDTTTQATQQLNLNRQVDGSGGTMIVEGVEPVSGIVWGRWTGNFTAQEDGAALNHNQNLHYVYSENVTPLANLQALTPLGVVSYTQLPGSGSATDHLGNTALSSTVNMGVDFTNQQIASYSVDVTTAGSGNFHGETSSAIAFTALDQSFTLTDSITPVCTGGCTGEASVAFVGGQAEAAMTSYSITNTTSGTGVSGTGVMTRP